MTVGQTYRIEEVRDTMTYRCRGYRGATMASVMRNFTIAPAMSRFGVVTSNATVRYAWLMMVRSP